MAARATTTRPACAAKAVTMTKRARITIPAIRAIRVPVMVPPFSQLDGLCRVARPAPRAPVASGLDGAEPSYPALELHHRLVQVTATHVGPQDVGEEELAVSDLPEEEVRDAGLARGADDEVGVGHVREVEVTPDGLLVDLVGRSALRDEGPDGIDDLGATAVVERHRHDHPRVVPGELDGLVHPLEHA